MANASDPELQNKYIHCKQCYEKHLDLCFDICITFDNHLVVICPLHGLIISLPIVPSDEIQKLTCAECGKSFEDGHAH